jgi:hypothetical protein
MPKYVLSDLIKLGMKVKWIASWITRINKIPTMWNKLIDKEIDDPFSPNSSNEIDDTKLRISSTKRRFSTIIGIDAKIERPIFLGSLINTQCFSSSSRCLFSLAAGIFFLILIIISSSTFLQTMLMLRFSP